LLTRTKRRELKPANRGASLLIRWSKKKDVLTPL
jgi:hypothetical protein